MINGISDAVKTHCDHCLHPHRNIYCCTCERPVYDIGVLPHAHNYVIDLLPDTDHHIIQPEEHVKQNGGSLKRQYTKSGKFYVNKPQMNGAAECIPVKFYKVHKCETDTHALAKLVSLLAPEMRLYCDSAYR